MQYIVVLPVDVIVYILCTPGMIQLSDSHILYLVGIGYDSLYLMILVMGELVGYVGRAKGSRD